MIKLFIMSLQLNKKLFDQIDKLGERQLKSFHILLQQDGEHKSYRIYHSKGHCIDIVKLFCVGTDFENDNLIDGYDYVYHSDIFEGFTAINVEDFLELIKNPLK